MVDEIEGSKPHDEPRPVDETKHLEGPQLTQREIDRELQHIRDNPGLIQGQPPNRSAKIGEHEWIEQPGGGWCRHSDPTKVVCALPSAAPVPKAGLEAHAGPESRHDDGTPRKIDEEPAAITGEAAPGVEGAGAKPKAVRSNIADAKRAGFDLLEDVKSLPDQHPKKYELKIEAESIRGDPDSLEEVTKGASPEELVELIKPEMDAVNARLRALREKVPVKELPEGAHTRLSQPGGLSATEGTRIPNPDGTLGPRSHPLEEHGPDADPNYLKNMVRSGGSKVAAKFNDRAVMETVIAEAIDADVTKITNWLATKPVAGERLGLYFSPKRGNLGTGFYKVGDKTIEIPANVSLENITVVLKADGAGGYIIQSAYPRL